MNTKKTVTFLLFFTIILTQNIKAQLFDFIPKPIENWTTEEDIDDNIGYYKDINGHFDKFIGTWDCSESDRYIKIQFYKVEKISIWDDLFYDMLFSFVEYKEKQNGQWITIYDTFGTPPVTIFNYDDHYGEIEGGRVINTNFIFLDYSEPLSEKCKKLRGTLVLKYQENSNPPQLIWERGSVMYVSDSPPECVGIEREPFKIPANLVLTKISNP